MTPAARAAAAIQVLDTILSGDAAQQSLVNWTRRNRYAGSGDRAAVRDLVFACLRQRRSLAALGGASDGRGLMLGHLKQQGQAAHDIFTGQTYAPAALTAAETAHDCDLSTLPSALRLDCPDWAEPLLQNALANEYAAVMAALQIRASLFLRINAGKSNVADAVALLAADNIAVQPHSLAAQALQVTANPRKIAQCRAYVQGIVEIQDVASQAVVEMIPLRAGQRILDFCAGGGGKSLAMAAREPVKILAHDIDPRRMRDLPARARRAGVDIAVAKSLPDRGLPGFDLVLCDAPCSGSGTWRRNPQSKWALTPHGLAKYSAVQLDVLRQASGYVAVNGLLVYATCALFQEENQQVVNRFLASNPIWRVQSHRFFSPLLGGDGMFASILARQG